MAKVTATHVGKAVAHSGLLPATSKWLLDYVGERYEDLVALLPDENTAGDLDGFFFAVAHACLQSPEFGHLGHESTRFLPWQIRDLVPNEYAERYAHLLVDPVWHANLPASNGAMIALEWITGRRVAELEGMFDGLRFGPIREMCRNLNWISQGLADILTAATVPHLPDAARPAPLKGKPEAVSALRKFPRVLRRLAWRVSAGLPDNVLWMTQLEGTADERSLLRREMLGLHQEGIVTPQQAMESRQAEDEVRLRVFSSVQPSPQRRANWFRDAARDWKQRLRERMADWQKQRAKHCDRADLVDKFYISLGSNFEDVFEEILEYLEIKFEKLDQREKTGAPDYKLDINSFDSIIVELKSKKGRNLVNYNDATKVLSASEVHGFGDKFCVSLCHPGVDPAVPNVIVQCGRLCVVDSADLGEALLRYCEGKLSADQLYDWLTTPGQALASDLPFSAN